MKRATREWVRKAEDDYEAAGELSGSSKRLHDQVCFLSQQSCEKYFKAILEEHGHLIPKSDDVDRLLWMLIPSHGTLGVFRRRLLFLNQFAVETRYPDKFARKRQAV